MDKATLPSWWTALTHQTWQPDERFQRRGARAQTFALVTRLRNAYRNLTRKRGEEVRIEHVKSHTGVRGNEAADKLAALGAQIQDGHRIVERNSHEPPMQDTEYKDNG